MRSWFRERPKSSVNAEKTGDPELPGLANSLADGNIHIANHNKSASEEAGQFREAPMPERKNGNQLQWFDQYRASKTVLFWACAGSAILATIVAASPGVAG